MTRGPHPRTRRDQPERQASQKRSAVKMRRWRVKRRVDFEARAFYIGELCERYRVALRLPILRDIEL
jgi:hypothetical protein